MYPLYPQIILQHSHFFLFLHKKFHKMFQNFKTTEQAVCCSAWPSTVTLSQFVVQLAVLLYLHSVYKVMLNRPARAASPPLVGLSVGCHLVASGQPPSAAFPLRKMEMLQRVTICPEQVRLGFGYEGIVNRRRRLGRPLKGLLDEAGTGLSGPNWCRMVMVTDGDVGW